MSNKLKELLNKSVTNNNVNLAYVYNKDVLNEIIDDTFSLEYSDKIYNAKIDFEDIIEDEYGLKTVKNNCSKNLYDIIKNNSSHYYNIKQDIHKNKKKYL